MNADLRRIVAVAAHLRRTGALPLMLHALGTGETFSIVPRPQGFLDMTSGHEVRVEDGAIVAGETRITLAMRGADVLFDAHDQRTGDRVSGRAGGASSVTIYAADGGDWFQYATVDETGL